MTFKPAHLLYIESSRSVNDWHLILFLKQAMDILHIKMLTIDKRQPIMLRIDKS